MADLVEPSSGRVPVMGGVPRRRAAARSASCSRIRRCSPWRTVLQNVTLPLEVGGGRSLPGARAPQELLELVGLSGWERRCRTSCRAACVSAWRLPAPGVGTGLLLMDEPFGALDEITRDRLNEELLQVWETTGTTIVFVTHSIYEAAFLGQSVLLLAARPGRVRELVPVTLPTPRKLAMRETAEFVALAGHLRRVLETC